MLKSTPQVIGRMVGRAVVGADVTEYRGVASASGMVVDEPVDPVDQAAETNAVDGDNGDAIAD